MRVRVCVNAGVFVWGGKETGVCAIVSAHACTCVSMCILRRGGGSEAMMQTDNQMKDIVTVRNQDPTPAHLLAPQYFARCKSIPYGALPCISAPQALHDLSVYFPEGLASTTNLHV